MDFIVTGLTALIGFLVIAAALYLNQEKNSKTEYTPLAQPGKPKRKKKKSKAKPKAKAKTASKKSSSKKSSKKSSAKKKKSAAPAAAAAPAAVEVKKTKKKADNIAGTTNNGETGMFASSFKGDKNDDEGWEQVKTKPRAEKPVVEESKEDDENLVIEKVTVNNIGRLIGKSGATINEIRTLSGATIAIPEKGSNSNKVVVKGSADEVQNAISMIKQEVGDDESNAPAYSTTIVVNNIGRLIGTGGKTIQSLTRDGVKIDTPKQRKGAGNVVKVSGPSKEAVDKIIEEIKEVIGDDDPTPQVVKTITVESQHRSLIIGRGGETIRKMTQESGARIDLGKGTGDCKVSGSEAAVAAAMKSIKAILKKAADTVTTAIDCDSNRFGLVIGRGGETIRALSSEFSVQIDTDDTNNQIKVRGDKKDVKKAIEKITGMLAKQKQAGPFGPLADGDESEIIEVADNLKGRIIGTRGATVNKLQADSGARIVFARKGSNESGCRLSGTAEQIAAAKKLIDEIKAKAKAQEEKAEAARAAAEEAAEAKADEPEVAEAAFVGISGDATGSGW